jgi:hypothetical protein
MFLSLADDLVTYLNAAPEVPLTAGVNLFTGEIPQGVRNAVLVLNSEGNTPHEYLNTESLVISIWTVYDNTPAGYDMAKQLYEFLHRKANYALENWYIYSSLAVSGIIDSDRTGENDKLHKVSFLFTCRLLASVS